MKGRREGWRDEGTERGMEEWRNEGMEGWREGGREGWWDGGTKGWRDGGRDAHWLGKFSHPEDIRPHAIFYLERYFCV